MRKKPSNNLRLFIGMPNLYRSMLYRFREAMLIEAGVKRNPNSKEPLLPETTTRVSIAEQARKDLVREISRKISQIQDRTPNPRLTVCMIFCRDDR